MSGRSGQNHPHVIKCFSGKQNHTGEGSGAPGPQDYKGLFPLQEELYNDTMAILCVGVRRSCADGMEHHLLYPLRMFSEKTEKLAAQRMAAAGADYSAASVSDGLSDRRRLREAGSDRGGHSVWRKRFRLYHLSAAEQNHPADH